MAEAMELEDTTGTLHYQDVEIKDEVGLEEAPQKEEEALQTDNGTSEEHPDSTLQHVNIMDVRNAPGRTESDMEWTPTALEELRLCRNRAYHKVNSKRRQHLPASLSSFTLKEWQSSHPNDKFSAKYILAIYNQHFDTTNSSSTNNHSGPNQKRGKKRPRSRGLEHSDTTEASPVVANSKFWTPEMLQALVECSDIAEERAKDDISSQFSNLLLEEWSKRFPDSSLTARNLKSRLTVFRRTRTCSSEPPTKKIYIRNENTNNKRGRKPKIVIKDEIIKRSDTETESEDQQDASRLPSNQVLDEVSDEFAPESSTDSSKPSNEDQGGSNLCQEVSHIRDKACDQHWIHLFPSHPKEEQCSLTEQLLQIRESLKGFFEEGNIFGIKKPKGFSLKVLKEWKKLYPNTDENIKSVSVKFNRFDRGPNGSHINALTIEKDESGRINLTPEVLNNLLKTRKIAEGKVGPDASSNLLTRRWKEEWRNIYPDLQCDWNAMVARYRYHFGKLNNCDSSTSDSKNGMRDISDPSETDDKVKGFRNWTGKMKEDLLETCSLIKKESPDLEAGSSEFNKLLLQRFLKLHPKCMESSRSIYSKVQSIERSESSSFQQQKNNLSNTAAKANSVQVKAELEVKIKVEETSDIDTMNCNSKLSEEKENAVVSENAGSKFKLNKITLQRQHDVDPNVEQEQIVKMEEEHVKLKEGKVSEETSENAIKSEEEPLPPLAGFEDWSLSVVSEFIACMNSALKKSATLKEQNPDGNVQLIPLLLKEWEVMYPNHTETVQTFLVRIKHLKQQKDLIKCHLYDKGLLTGKDGGFQNSKSNGLTTDSAPKKSPSNHYIVKKKSTQIKKKCAEANGEDFKWTKDMIDDVINSRMKAVKMKEEGTKLGKKLSFHTLWADEFKKVYPNSTFTSNNLSVHLWSWRKQQQKLGKPDPLYDKTLSLQDTSRPLSQPPPSMTSVSSWTLRLKSDLLQIGKLVQQNLSNKGTPNEQKLKGFPNMLHAEWKHLYPNRNDTVRGLNMMYSRLCREGINIKDSQVRGNVCVWNPKRNKMLRECIKSQSKLETHSNQNFCQKVIDEFKEKFPSVEVDNNALLQRVVDMIQVDKSLRPDFGLQKIECRSQSINSTDSIESQSKVKSEFYPNVDWSNKQTIQDLLTCYQTALKSKDQNQTALSDRVQREFLKHYPNCKAAPTTLMARLYCYKEQLRNETLDLQGTKIKVIEDDSSATVEEGDKTGLAESAKGIPQGHQTPAKIAAPKQDIVFRTWTKEMIDNLTKTKKIAVVKKQKLLEEGYIDIQLIDVWYEEFIRLHPDYKSTKKNLMQKYKWYRSRMKKLGVSELPLEKSNCAPQSCTNKVENVDAFKAKNYIRKDVFTHIKALMEETRIFLPMKLPEEPILKQDMASFPGAITPESPQSLPNVAMSVSPVLLCANSMIMDNSGSLSSQQLQPDAQVIGTNRESSLSRPNMTSMESSAAQTLAQLHQRTLTQDQLLKEIPSQSPHMFQSPTSSCEEKSDHEAISIQEDSANPQGKKDTIKLPGGATLVAVTDRNADTLLKPKLVEKPHVTITIGDKSKSAEERGSPMSPPSSIAVSLSPSLSSTSKQPVILQQPINIPKFHLPAVTPPPLPQLKPFGIEMNKKQANPIAIFSSVSQTSVNSMPVQSQASLQGLSSLVPRPIFIPSKVKDKMDEYGLSEHQFLKLLSIYDVARNEYINTLKKGYLAFFPYYLGEKWKIHSPGTHMTGRKLASIVDLYVEEKNKGRVITPEYLTKKPCQFAVTEDLLQAIMSVRKEVATDVEKKEQKPINPAFIDAEFCKKWSNLYPDKKMTNKQLLSIYQILVYDIHKGASASPEVQCSLADIWRLLEKNIPQSNEEIGSKIQGQAEQNAIKYDMENFEDLSIDKRQELLLRAQFLPRKHKKLPGRPRFAIKNLRLFWTNKRLQSLEVCRQKAIRKLQNNLKRPYGMNLMDMIYYMFKDLYPNLNASKTQVVAKCVRNIRLQKRENRRVFEKEIHQWKLQCKEFVLSEEITKVIEEPEIKPEQEIEEEKFCLAKDMNVSCRNRNFNDDEEVLKYLAEMQKAGKSYHMLTWTSDVLRDLITARATARKRKREWEEWATNKYGGIGFAYSNPDVKYAKVDDMFKEEWSKIRPEMSNLSIWTLVAYARKFDTLKKQLLAENNQELKPDFANTEKKKTFQSPVFFENSAIPKFDLEILAKLRNAPEDFRDMLATRQRAKELQIEGGSKFHLLEIWLSEWLKLHPGDFGILNGYDLQKRLWILEQNSELLRLVKPALLKQTVSEKVYPIPQEFEVPRICPRKSFFPEDKDMPANFDLESIINVPSKIKGKLDMKLLTLNRDYFNEKRLKLDVPAVRKIEDENAYDDDDEALNEPDEDDWFMQFEAKSRLKLKQKPFEEDIKDFVRIIDTKEDDKPKSKAVFHNINNLIYCLNNISSENPVNFQEIEETPLTPMNP